ncbi:MAG TPA: hypothetical protein VE196_00910 [Pseudonocardiaceae bacterium]|nr:hypothetical protein [Pseudonocardiaceae bacterium]
MKGHDLTTMREIKRTVCSTTEPAPADPREHGRQAARSKRVRPERASEWTDQSSHVRAAVGGALEYARHGRSIGGGSPLEEEVV